MDKCRLTSNTGPQSVQIAGQNFMKMTERDNTLRRAPRQHLTSGAPMNDEVNPLLLEEELAQHVRGLGLVGELNLDPDSDTYRMAHSTVSRTSQNGILRMSRLVPVSLVIVLTADGRYRYEGGTFWPNCSVPAIALSSPADQKHLFEAFSSALQGLGIDSFADELRALRQHYQVQSILMQGGIPEYCAADLWRLIASDIDDGRDDADRILARWRRNPNALHAVDVPVRNFVRWGREQAVDLVARMVDVLQATAPMSRQELSDCSPEQLGDDHGLPSYLIESLVESQVRTSRRAIGKRLPRPRVLIDETSGDGPFVELPTVDCDSRWTIRDKTQSSISGSRYEVRDRELNPAEIWTVSLRTEEEEREHLFPRANAARAYFFDDRGELLKNQERLVGPFVLALTPTTTEILTADDSPAPSPLTLPPRTGAWSAWKLTLLDCRGVSTLVLKESQMGETRLVRFPVRAGIGRPVLVGDQVGEVTSSAGDPVYSATPYLQLPQANVDQSRWRIRARRDDRSAEAPAWTPVENLSHKDGRYELSDLIDDTDGFAGVIEVRGPLGSDLHESVVVVPGLTCRVPQRLVGPDEQVIAEVSAEIPVFLNGAHQSSIAFVGDDGRATDTARCPARLKGSEVDLVVRCTRVMWALRRVGGHGQFTTIPELLSIDEITGLEVLALTVRTRREAEVSLVLGTGETVQRSGPQRTLGSEGKWTFSLHEFTSTLARSREPVASLKVQVDDTEILVARVAARLAVSKISVESLVDTESDFAICQVHWFEERRLKHRVLRLWSDTRPWEPPISVPIPDEADGELTFSIDDSIRPGWYTMHFDVEGGDWGTPPIRPTRESRNARLVQIGTRQQYLRHEKTIASGGAAERLEYEFTDIHNNVGAVASEQVPELLDALAHSLLVESHEFSTKSYDSRRMNRIVDLLLSDATAFLEWAPNSLARHLQRGRGDAPGVVLAFARRLATEAPRVSLSLKRQLWTISAPLGAAVTKPGESPEGDALWFEHTGWPADVSAREGDEGGPGGFWSHLTPGRPVEVPFVDKGLESLRVLRLEVGGQKVQLLASDGQFDCMFDFLERRTEMEREVTAWVQSVPPVARTADPAADELAPRSDLPSWCDVPRILHRLAQIGFSSGFDNPEVLGALNAASVFADGLSTRSQLIVIANYWKAA